MNTEVKTKEERLAQVAQVNKLRKTQNMSIKDACDQIGLTLSTYNYYEYRKGKQSKPIAAAKVTRKPYKPRLKVTELPIAPPKSMGFILFGTPDMLAQFARSYE